MTGSHGMLQSSPQIYPRLIDDVRPNQPIYTYSIADKHKASRRSFLQM